ncbi:MAG: serine/threonine-protein kinase, partial [Myxococcota bacterium]
MRRLGKYELESEIGHGGMATVYRARDLVLERCVAVKVLHPHLRKSSEARERFTREARSVARLRHPYIMEIHDFAGEDAEESYLVAELLTGPTLRELVDAHRLPAEAAVALALPVAEALAAAHDAGIVHRDVKPENVLLHEGRTVKLTDFGIAQMVDAHSFTHTGQILGSPGHMAPEQIETGEVDARSDVFALGTVLYLLATGTLPFHGKNAHQVLKQVVDCEHPDPLRLRPSIGKELAQILQRAMAKAPEDRYASAGELAGALRAFLLDHGIDDPAALLET